MSQCCVSLSLVWSCNKLVTFLFALSEEDNQCLSEKNPGSLCRRPVSSTYCSLWNGSRAEMSAGGIVLCHFFFFSTQQCSLGFSDMEHSSCCGVPSRCIFYAIPFLEAPGGQRPRAPCPLAAGRGAALGVPVPLRLPPRPAPAVPLVCKLPAFILSANMYKM